MLEGHCFQGDVVAGSLLGGRGFTQRDAVLIPGWIKSCSLRSLTRPRPVDRRTRTLSCSLSFISASAFVIEKNLNQNLKGHSANLAPDLQRTGNRVLKH